MTTLPERLLDVIAEMQSYVEQEYEPELDKVADWLARLEVAATALQSPALSGEVVGWRVRFKATSALHAGAWKLRDERPADDGLIEIQPLFAPPAQDDGWVRVPRDWFFGAQEFIARFTSGNSVPREVRAIAVKAGPTIAQEATALRDLLAAAPSASLDVGDTK